ncbi:MAG TPA: tryptophan synthase subunit alpha [Alphaproteobacteria bacterium]|nr:tryptophan synthase subunit alpha [Alphaproteobacteria bacterium]
MSAAADSRLTRRFADLRAQGRGGLVTYLTAGDPDYETSLAIFRGLPKAGVDVIEIGMPFSDPMADGPAIQAAGLRALKAGASLKRTLALVAAFRRDDSDTPIVLMGYYNPIYRFGVERFCAAARDAGVDGLIVVDLPPEEDHELRPHARAAGLEIIRLATPTTDAKRLPTVLDGAGGFIYYVAVLGVTGTRSAAAADVAQHLAQIREMSDLPIAVGFGIKTPAQAAEIARFADAAVVGSALVQTIADRIDAAGTPKSGLVEALNADIRALADAVRNARAKAPA